MERGIEVARLLEDSTCLGLTRDGHPRHPLYLSKRTGLKPFSGGVQ
jgi:hypothetical protein